MPWKPARWTSAQPSPASCRCATRHLDSALLGTTGSQLELCALKPMPVTSCLHGSLSLWPPGCTEPS